MSLILVFEPDSADRERIESALVAEGWSVDVEEGASERPPDLVVLSSAHPAARRVAERFARSAGGPGVLVLDAERAAVRLPGEGALEKPFSDQQIRSAVRRCLAKVQREVAEEAAREAASSGAQLTSADLFGDMLAEVEDEVAGRSGGAGPRSDRPPVPPPSAGAPVRKRRRAEDEDLDAEIERTLSGVLGTGAGKPRGKTAGTPPRRDDDELDELLSQTLSGLGVTGRRRRPKEPEGDGPPAPSPPSPPATSGDAPSEAVGPPSPPGGPGVSPDPEPPIPGEEPGDPLATQRMEALRPEDLPKPEREPTPVPEPQPEPEAQPAPEPEAEAEEREAFGQYTMLERVAVGGMAEVWKARMRGMEGFQKTVAIKRILPHLTDSSDFVTMFIDEAKLAAQLNHPHIIHIYDLGKIGDDYYIAMEYVEGKDLRSILNEGRDGDSPLPLGLALLVAARLASGLDYAHRKRDFEDRELGLVHRDVSPQNVLISYEGDIKLCDFGIVKAVAKASKTQMGALKGKLQYMSPEQAWGRAVDARSDIFSLGAVLFEMLTGSRLFAGDSELSVLEAVRDCRVRSPREVNRDVPKEVEAIVAKALREDPDDRYQTAGDFQKELEEVLYALKPTPSQGDLAAYMGTLFAVEEAAARAEEAARSEESPHPGDEEGEEVAAMPPLAAIEPDRADSRRGLWVGVAAAAILAAVVVGWFLLAGRGEEPGSPASPGALEAATATVQPVDPGAETEGTVPGEASPPAGPTDEAEPLTGSTEEAEPLADTDSEPAAGTGDDVDLQALVDAQVRERDEELRRRFEEEKRRLAAEIAEAREGSESGATNDPAEAPPAEPGPAGETEAVESALEASREEERVASDPTPPTESELSGDAATVADATATPSPTGGEEGVEPRSSPEAEEEAPAATAAPPPPSSETESRARESADRIAPPSEPPPPSVEPGQMVDAGTPGLSPPRLVSIDRPEYPPIARRMKVQGTVIVSVLVDETGEVQESRLVQGVSQNVGLNEAALEAARSARFQPASLEGVRVKTWFNLRIPFQLGG